jgi:hypothetical protein
MSTPVKIILAIVVALILLGFLRNLLLAAVFYGVLAAAAIAILALLWRWLVGRDSAKTAAARPLSERKIERRATKELKVLERRVQAESHPTPTTAPTVQEPEQQKLGQRGR